MLSRTQTQGFLTLQRPHENDSHYKITFWWLAALLETATPEPERLQLGGGVYTLLNKRFLVAGRENNGDLGRNPTYEVSLFCFDSWVSCSRFLVSPRASKDCSVSATSDLSWFWHFHHIPNSSSCSFLGWKVLIHSLGPLLGASPLWRYCCIPIWGAEPVWGLAASMQCQHLVFYHFYNIPWYHLWFLSVLRRTTELVRTQMWCGAAEGAGV